MRAGVKGFQAYRAEPFIGRGMKEDLCPLHQLQDFPMFLFPGKDKMIRQSIFADQVPKPLLFRAAAAEDGPDIRDLVFQTADDPDKKLVILERDERADAQ